MIRSVFYMVSVLALFAALLAVPKTEKKLSLCVWIAPLFLLIEYFACAVGGILTALSIPADLGTIAAANGILAAVLAIYTRKTGKVQPWSFCVWDLFALVIVVGGALLFANARYTADLLINFETSDPSIHMQMAMDSMNLHSVMSYRSFMYIGQFTNSLFLQLWRPFVPFEILYKVFILKLILNWIFSGWMFYACIAHRCKDWFGHLVGFLCTIGYFYGYPLTDLLFGFVYLQQCMTTCLLILFLTGQVQQGELPRFFAIPALSISCLAVSLGYTLFGVTVFVALALSMTVHYWQRHRTVFQWQYFKMQLSIFVFPTLMTVLYAFVIIKKYRNLDAGALLSSEGYIYRNLYSDFVLLAPLALFGFLLLWKECRRHFLVSLFGMTGITMGVLFLAMLTRKISTYYYYKINFLVWTVLWLCGAIALLHLSKEMRRLAVSIVLCGLLLVSVFVVDFEKKLNEWNIQVTPEAYVASETWFRNYWYTRLIMTIRLPYSPQKVELYQRAIPYVEEGENPVCFIGYWLDDYWFEAITNVRGSANVSSVDEDWMLQMKDSLQKLESGTMVVFMSDGEKYMQNTELAQEWVDQVDECLKESGRLLYGNEAGKIYQIN